MVQWCHIASWVLREFRIKLYSSTKISLKVSSEKWWSFCSRLISLDVNVRFFKLIYQYHISMAKCKTAVTPLLTHWSYCSLALSHRYHVEEMTRPWGATINLRRTIGWILLFQEINSTAAAIAAISPYSAEFNLGNMKIYCIFFIISQHWGVLGTPSLMEKSSFVLHIQYHGCWWHGDAKSLGISNQAIVSQSNRHIPTSAPASHFTYMNQILSKHR